MSEIINDITKMLSTHWAFFAVVFIFMIIGQITKTTIFTKRHAEDTYNKWYGHFYWWGRKTLPLHPVISGAIVGMYWTHPNKDIMDSTSAIFYFAFAGAISVWFYQILKGIFKKKGIELSLPGSESNVPPNPNE